MFQFHYKKSLILKHPHDCELNGITPDMTLYITESDAEGRLTQHILRSDGAVIAAIDDSDADMLPLPTDIITPNPPRRTLLLNYSGARHRGLREADRISDIVRPLSIQTRMQLTQKLARDIAPPALLGVAESYVLAEALLHPPDTYIVCRRLRLAYLLSHVQYDSHGQPYDYDTLELYSAHLYDRASEANELSPEQVLSGLPGIAMRRPMDCLIYNDHLFIADGGTPDDNSAVHIWQITPAG